MYSALSLTGRWQGKMQPKLVHRYGQCRDDRSQTSPGNCLLLTPTSLSSKTGGIHSPASLEPACPPRVPAIHGCTSTSSSGELCAAGSACNDLCLFSGPVVAKANLGYGGSFDETRRTPRGSLRSRRHWSNVSSLSTDSGIVGVNDARDDLDPTAATRTKSADVERADSGIGQMPARKWRNRASETLSSLQAWEAHRPCTDCGERDLPVETDVQNCNQRRADLCEKCRKRRTERKESVLEFVNTEASYGEDLRIIKEEFYLPMQAAGLLSQEQLQGIFSNIQELIDLNESFLEILQEEIDQAFDQV